jgi:hypothetical protein
MGYSANICIGGTASAQTEGFGYVAAYAFDGGLDTFWHSDGSSQDCWVKYDLGSGVAKAAIQYVINVRRYGMYRYPTSWLFQGSNDDSEWTTLDYQEGIVFEDGVGQTFKDFENTTEYRYYRWRFLTSSDSQYHNIAELQIMEFDPYTVDVCVDGTPSHDGGYQAVDKGFDDNPSTYCQNWNSVPYYIKYDFGEGITKIPVKYTIMNSVYGPSYIPTAWTFEGSNDNSEWTELDAQTDISWSGQYEKKTFTFANEIGFRYIRWWFTGQSVAICIGELEVMEYDVPPPPPTAAPVNYLCSRERDRSRSKGISLGMPLRADGNSSFLIARRNRLRTRGISLEEGVLFVNTKYIGPLLMTANNAPAPWIVSARSEYSAGYEAFRAFRYAESGDRWSSAGEAVAGSFLKVDAGLGNRLLVTHLFLKQYPGQGFNSFKVQGSINDVDWTDIYSGSAADSTAWQIFTFENSESYRYVRLLCVTGYMSNYISVYACMFFSHQPACLALSHDTFDPNHLSGAPATLSNGNLTAALLDGAWAGVPGIRLKNSGKWYFEVSCDQISYAKIGVGAPLFDPTMYGYQQDGQKYDENYNASAFGDSYAAGAVIGVAVDLDNLKIWFSKNGVWQASGDPGAGTNPAFTIPESVWRPFVSLAYSQVTANFGTSAFVYDVPEGFNSGWYDEG